MRRISLLLAAILVAASAGCNCCGWMTPRHQVACPPAPVCDPCATAPVTYGPAPPMVSPYTPPPQW